MYFYEQTGHSFFFRCTSSLLGVRSDGRFWQTFILSLKVSLEAVSACLLADNPIWPGFQQKRMLKFVSL